MLDISTLSNLILKNINKRIERKNNASWNDDVHSSNAENIEDKLLTTFVTGTVDEITKLPLSKDFVETMVVNI